MVLSLCLLLAATGTFDESFRSGLLALQRNDLPAALTNLEESARMAPSNGRVWVALSQTYWKLNQTDKAAQAAAKASAVAPKDPAVLQALAIYYKESGQSIKAAAAQTSYAATVPQNASAREQAASLYFEAAQPLLKEQKFADAIVILEQARKALPNEAQLELALGVAYYGLRRFDDAAAAFLRTIAIAPDTEQPYIFLGEFLDQVPDRLPEIARRFAEYDKTHPDNYKGPLLHAKALDAQAAEPERAEALLKKALALNDRDPAVHKEFAGLLDRLQRFSEAVSQYESTVALNPSDAVAHYRLARDYDRLGKRDEAQAQREIHAKLTSGEGAVR